MFGKSIFYFHETTDMFSFFEWRT